MRSSAVVALALLAAAGPAFAAPVAAPQSAPFARRGAAPTIVSAPSVPSNQTSVNATSIDQSGALKLGTIASIASVALPFVGSIINHFTNNGQQQQARELEELLRRAEAEDESGAISLKTVASIGSVLGPVVAGLFSHFTGGDNQQQQREFVEMLARDVQAQEGSEAFSFSDLKNIGSIAFHVGDAVKNIFDGFSNNNQQQQRREIEEFLARAVDESGAITLEQGANIASIGSSIVGVAEPLFKDIYDHFHKSSRSDEESGAITLEQGANIASIGSSIIGAAEPIFKDIYDHFHKSSRADDESGALTLEQGANIASIGSSIVGVAEPLFKDIYDHFHKSSRSDDESGAITLEQGANIASIGSSIVGVAEPLIKDIYDHFHKSSRDVQTDESGAINFKTIASIGSVLGPIAAGLISHFTGGDNQQQQRDFEELAARAFTEEEITSLLSIGSSVAGAAAPLINDVVDHFTHKSSRDFSVAARTINDLD